MRGGLSCQGWDSYNLTTKYLPITKDIYPLLKRKEAELDDCAPSNHEIQIGCWQWRYERYLRVRHVLGNFYEILVLDFSKLYVRGHIQF